MYVVTLSNTNTFHEEFKGNEQAVNPTQKSIVPIIIKGTHQALVTSMARSSLAGYVKDVFTVDRNNRWAPHGSKYMDVVCNVKCYIGYLDPCSIMY